MTSTPPDGHGHRFPDSQDRHPTPRRHPAGTARSLLDEFERSGLSAARFAALTGLKYPTFASWGIAI